MSELKDNVGDLIQKLKKKRNNETDATKRHNLAIKIDELKKLYDSL